MATPQQIASQAGSANTAYKAQAAMQSLYGRKRKPNQQQTLAATNQALVGQLGAARGGRSSTSANAHANALNKAVAGFGDTYRARQENKALKKAGRARRKKGGNYTAYGQTGGTLAPSGKAGNSHGIAIVNGSSGQAREKNKAVTGFIKEQQMQRLQTSANDGLYIDRRPHRKGRKRGRPQYTTGTGAINPKTGNRLYF